MAQQLIPVPVLLAVARFVGVVFPTMFCGITSQCEETSPAFNTPRLTRMFGIRQLYLRPTHRRPCTDQSCRKAMAARLPIRSSLGSTDSRPRNSSERVPRRHCQHSLATECVHCCGSLHLQHHAHNVLLHGAGHQRCFEMEDTKPA